jgi:hypothetical protein
VYVPFETPVVSQETLYGFVVSSDPIFVEPTLNCTPATATLSDAVAVSEIVPETVAKFAGAVSEIVGAVVSGHVLVVKVLSPVVTVPAAFVAKAR